MNLRGEYMGLIEGLELGDGIVVKNKMGVESYKQVAKYAYKGYRVRNYGDFFDEIKRVEQCDVVRNMTKEECDGFLRLVG